MAKSKGKSGDIPWYLSGERVGTDYLSADESKHVVDYLIENLELCAPDIKRLRKEAKKLPESLHADLAVAVVEAEELPSILDAINRGPLGPMQVVAHTSDLKILNLFKFQHYMFSLVAIGNREIAAFGTDGTLITFGKHKLNDMDKEVYVENPHVFRRKDIRRISKKIVKDLKK